MTTSILLAAALSVGTPNARLSYNLPAPDDMRGWEERSLPVGNGWFGVNVFGGVHSERLQVTEPTFLTRRNLTNALEIRLNFTYPSGVDGYRRGLDLGTGVTWMEQSDGPCKFRREAFASYPARVFAWRVICSEKGKLNFSVSPEVPYQRQFGRGREAYVGRTAHIRAEGNAIDIVQHLQWYNVRFFGRILVETDGRLETLDHTIDVKDATTATVYLSCATNYRLCPESFGAAAGEFSAEANEPKMRDEDEPSEAVKARVAAAAKKGYEALKAEHIADFGGLMGRVDVDLGDDAGDRDIPTDRLLEDYAKGRPSAYLEKTYFQYGRYLLVSSSRPGTLPASLQGVWTAHDKSPWGSGYWHNINVQMNYWPAFNCNLAECFEAYAAFNAAFRPVTRRFVKEYLERHKLGNVPADGEAPDIWCVGTAVYPYAVCGGPGVHSGPGTGGFTTKCFKDWWDFTRDEKALRTYIWPTLHGMADFLTRCVKEQDGACLSAFSASPEQQRTKKDANGETWSYIHTVGCAFDQQMIQENNADMLELAKVLGVKDRVTELVEKQMGRYEPVIVGESGQVKEFREEKKYGDLGEYRHRHISQLVGLYPGSIINKNTPEWLAAARVTLTERGDQSTGWALAHRLTCWARLGDGDHCHKLIRNLLSQRTNANLWDMHPPFQIDGNFGATAGIAEMLLQSHAGYIDLLPSLPTAWAKAGSFRGLCARGVYEVDCAWKDGKPVSVSVRSKKGGTPEVRFAGQKVPFELSQASAPKAAR